ncbi:MAG: protein-L-isoaspartate(D-aspartate) O-methyltransferase [Desulfobacteraceae bacterium]|nr:protein-L-isoaspartate(D-aspartate) O-methyltransferase [Desulfobacteraceae bacterium]
MSHDFSLARERMVKNQLIPRGINDERVLQVMGKIPRHLFIEEALAGEAYNDHPVPIGEKQTISQPYIVALMTELLSPQAEDRILEVGTGSGYQAAILAHFKISLYSIERLSVLAKKALFYLTKLGYKVKIKVGDGTLGWPENSPYDKIIVTAASPEIPVPLLKQLRTGGRMVIPLGGYFHQNLTVIDKVSAGEIVSKTVCGCIFVPLVGEYGYKE